MYSSGVFLPILTVETLSFLFVVFLYRKLRRSAVVEPSDRSVSSVSGSVSVGRQDTSGRSGDDSSLASGIVPENQRSSNGPQKRYRKAAIVLGALVIVLNLCLLLFLLYSLSISLFCPPCNNPQVRRILVDVIYLNSGINPFLYALTMSKIRNF